MINEILNCFEFLPVQFRGIYECVAKTEMAAISAIAVIAAITARAKKKQL